MRSLRQRIADAPRRAVAAALLVLVVLGVTVVVTLAVDGPGGEPSLRAQLTHEGGRRTALARQLTATTADRASLRKTLDRRTRELRFALRQRDAAHRARQRAERRAARITTRTNAEQ